MLPITGDVDRWSVRPGEEINFMIGVRGGGRYRARIARVICGDPNPQGPGYREIPVSWALEGEHEGEEQLDSAAARLITNVVKRFANSAPFPAPRTADI